MKKQENFQACSFVGICTEANRKVTTMQDVASPLVYELRKQTPFKRQEYISPGENIFMRGSIA